MFTNLGRLVFRHRRAVLALGLLLLLVAGAWGTTVFSRLV